MPRTDYLFVKCSDIREALSARIDGETASLPDTVLDQHVEGCPECRSWQDQAVRLRRSMLVREAPAVPDLSERILANVPAPSAEKWGVRIALTVVALAQSGLGVAELLGGGDAHAGHGALVAATHLSNESAAWNVAVGIGLLWAALRPRAASGLLPAFGGFVLVLALISAIDASDGQVTAGRLLTHSLVVAGVGLLFAVHRQVRRTPAPGPDTRAAAHAGDDVELPGAGPVAVPKSVRRRFPQRPASRRRAA
jgi:predicted anti-sigma-YlaC factor YlaD